ncbi:hypothetical protein QVD17_39138 [Tagetes erecta]|uniref:Serpin domain-containing protein n=1 Tax=Tagetes erecta TaxID=13708 RepID=A0AAD8NFZ3_TARER|nr:hypothetical protein QVD17_39138 [Tagetes erecta]
MDVEASNWWRLKTMVTMAVKAAKEVNLWAEKQTKGLIKQVLPSSSVNNLTWLILANAIYFKGVWKRKFDSSMTEKSDFHLLNGEKVLVPFMKCYKSQYVCEYDDFKVLGLPYLQGEDEREFTMYFYLPNAKDGLQSLLNKIRSTSNFFDDHIPYGKIEIGKLLLPKFKISFGFKACDVLKELGLVLPFDDEAGLSEMVDSFDGQNIYDSSIHHTSFVEVNEEGTKATAVTAFCGMGCAPKIKPMVDFVADHPFLFVIREDVSGAVLFMGQVIDPRVGRSKTLHRFIFFNQISSTTSSSSMDLEQSISNQTHVSTTLATHLLSSKFPNSNIVFSPLSIHVVLSLVAAGSKGPTLDQLLTFLKTKSTDDLNSLSSQLVTLIFADGTPNGGPSLAFANGVWVEKTLPFKPSFKQVVDTVYKALSNQVDFQTKAVEVANEVNSWAEKHTNGLIKEVLPAGAVDNSTRLIFANAVYFKGAWSEKFDQSKTKESDFHLLDGNKVQVSFMTSKKKQYVHEYDDFKVLGLPYLQGQDKRQFTTYFYLPNAKDGLQSLVKKIGSTSNFIERHIPRQKVEVGEFLLPKFKISFGFEASDVLKELGLVLPFNGGGLSEMVDSAVGQSLYVSSIHHKSFVEVNEEGTEAAAASVAVMKFRSIMVDEKVDFVADHPFLFVIREDMTGVVLFMGQVIDPRVG